MTRGDSRTSVFEELKDVDLVRWELDSESAKHPYKAEKLQSSVSERRGTEGGEKQGQPLRSPHFRVGLTEVREEEGDPSLQDKPCS